MKSKRIEVDLGNGNRASVEVTGSVSITTEGKDVLCGSDRLKCYNEVQAGQVYDEIKFVVEGLFEENKKEQEALDRLHNAINKITKKLRGERD